MKVEIQNMRRWAALGSGVAIIAVIGLVFSGDFPGVALAQDAQPGVILYDNYPAAGAAEDYVLNGAKWDHNPVSFSIENCPRSLDCNTAKDTIRKAFQLWDQNCGIDYVEVPTNGDSRFSWYTENSDGPGGILGQGYFPNPLIGDLAGDVQLDDAETWVVTPAANPLQIDLLTVALHEIGHSLGLEHSHDQTAVMWAEYTGPRSLSPDDIAACQALYGMPNGAPPPTPAAVTAAATADIRIHTGPGTDFPTVGTLPQGTSVPVIGRNGAGDWLYVQYAGLRGWIAGWLATVSGDLHTVPVVDQNGNGATPPPGATPIPTGTPPTQPGTPPTQPPTQPAPGAITGIATTTARVRSGPGTGYAPVGSIPSGATVAIVGRDAAGAWVFIQYGDVQGWVATWVFTLNGDLNSVPVLQSQDKAVSAAWPDPGRDLPDWNPAM